LLIADLFGDRRSQITAITIVKADHEFRAAE
jgi:hypothetical protein